MMHIYAMLFLIGVLGLLAQTLLGMAGPHGGGGGHGHAHAGHSHAGHHGGHAHGRAGSGRGQNGGSRFGELMLSLLSPLTLFSLCVGVGATGLVLHPYHFTDLMRGSLSVFGGLLFYTLIIKPMWGLIFRFASTPAGALEGTVAGSAEALSRFDASGKGLVRLTIDGQVVRVLAFLEADDRGQADQVVPGDTLTVVSVDGHANTCRVARL